MNTPEYVFMICNLVGERRFASYLSKRLESLGVLTHCDRRASDLRYLSQLNAGNKFAKEAMRPVLLEIFEVKHDDLTGDECSIHLPFKGTHSYI